MEQGEIASFLPLAFLVGIGLVIYYFATRGRQARQAEIARRPESISPLEKDKLADPKVIIKTYGGRQADTAAQFQVDAAQKAARGYFPTGQTWVPGQWPTGAFVVAILLILLFGLGILILGYLIIVKPPGTLTVTYELRAASVDEKTCPECAERIKAAALVCHFCGHKFAPEEIETVKSQLKRDALAQAERDALAQAEFPNELNDYLYRVEKDGSVSAIDRVGSRVQFRDWQSFWNAAH